MSSAPISTDGSSQATLSSFEAAREERKWNRVSTSCFCKAHLHTDNVCLLDEREDERIP